MCVHKMFGVSGRSDNWFLCLLVLSCLFLLPTTATSQDDDLQVTAGQRHLDQAVQLKLGTRAMSDLQKVIQLCEAALAEGLDEGNVEFASTLLSSTAYEHAARITEEIFKRDPPPRRWPLFRQVALRDLKKALKYDRENGEAQLLIARLQWLPGGDRESGRAAADAAVRLLADDNLQMSEALVARAKYRKDAEQRTKDFDEAVRLDPRNVEAWRARGMDYLARGEAAQAVDNFLKLLELDASDITALQAVATVLTSQKKLDEALTYVNLAIELSPESLTGYKLRAQIYALGNDIKAALEDLSTVLETEPGDVAALLMRARMWLQQGELKSAKADVALALDLKPGLVQAMLLRSFLAATEDRYADAIADLQTLLQDDPKNVELRMQIATFFYQDKRPSNAVAMCTSILADDGDNWRALRLRGDAFLLAGDHADAVPDYEASLQLQPKDRGLLNNLAWVLGTSPHDAVRDGERSIKLAIQACEVTDYKAAHILSTLAAGYAEIGDFQTAQQWSTKAIELAQEELRSNKNGSKEVETHLIEQLRQLENELASYKQKKPWRELLETKEEPESAGPKVDDLRINSSDSGRNASTPAATSESSPAATDSSKKDAP